MKKNYIIFGIWCCFFLVGCTTSPKSNPSNGDIRETITNNNNETTESLADTQEDNETNKKIKGNNNDLRKEWETCGEKIGECEADLICFYPCGIQGCEYVCAPKDSLPRP